MTAPGPSRSLGGLNLHFTKLSRVFAGILVAGYLAQLIAPSSRQYLALVPGRWETSLCCPLCPRLLCQTDGYISRTGLLLCRFIPCVWNIFTAGLLETSLWRVRVVSLDIRFGPSACIRRLGSCLTHESLVGWFLVSIQ